MSIGSFTFILHSHMPHVLSHGAAPHGSDWLSEAADETYLPLLDVFHRLISEGISPKVTLGITPILAEQLASSEFQKAFLSYIDKKIGEAKRDEKDFEEMGNSQMKSLAKRWQDWYSSTKNAYLNRWDCDIIGAFKHLQDEGHIEIITSSATHGYSPLLSDDKSLKLQIKTGVTSYRKRFGKSPRGYWLPECAYRPRGSWSAPSIGSDTEIETRERSGIEEILAEYGVKYFVAESSTGLPGSSFDSPGSSGAFSRGIGRSFDRSHADRTTVRANENGIDPKSASPYKSYVVNSSGSTLRKVRVFFRDPATGAQVWSANTGYPGGQWYLDFHAKRRLPGEVLPGLRYWRVSPHGTPEEGKSLYEPEKISEQVQDNARHFALVVRDSLRQRGDGPESIVCSVYDTELFGHWWYEGPDFLYHAIKEIDAIEEIRRATCMEHIDSLPESSSDSICLPEGSWGANSTHEVWLNTDTNWIWKEIYGAEAKLEKLNSLSQSRIKRITAQAKREFLLLTSSDWPFLVTGGAARDYAELRFHTHLTHFNYLCDMANKASQGEDISKNDWKNLADCEQMDRIFTEL